MAATHFTIEDWGLIEYSEALARQEALVEKVATEKSRGVLVICQHPAVVTLGRKTQPDDLQGWTGPTIEISRGGRATYHGPSQLVLYPIWNLDSSENPRPRDLHWYLRSLETVIINTVRDFGIIAQGRSLQEKVQAGQCAPGLSGAQMSSSIPSQPSSSEETGVWVGKQKLASLGIAVRKWVTFHGLALNVDEDSLAFQGIRPCGFNSDVMTSMEKLCGHGIDHEVLKAKLIQNFAEVFVTNP